MKHFIYRNFLRGLMLTIILGLIDMSRPAFAQEKMINMGGLWKGEGEFALVKIDDGSDDSDLPQIGLLFIKLLEMTPIGKAKFFPQVLSDKDGNPMIPILQRKGNTLRGEAMLHLPPDKMQARCAPERHSGKYPPPNPSDPFSPRYTDESTIELTISEDGNTLHGRYIDVNLEPPNDVCGTSRRSKAYFWVPFILRRVCQCQAVRRSVPSMGNAWQISLRIQNFVINFPESRWLDSGIPRGGQLTLRFLSLAI